VTEETPPITCLIADDHEVVREGLRLALSRTPHIRVVGEAADGEAAVALADRRRPDIVIMDVRMGGMDGFEAATKIRDGASNAAVLFFTAHAERNLLTRGREAGARGYDNDPTVKVPGEIDAQRARRILEELRKRYGETDRPQMELDYIERLLKGF
jgi:DNA-binding NarL/FixJ family response regulator